MITARDILLGVVLPAGVAALVVLAGALLGRLWTIRRALVPLAAGGAFMAGYAALLHVPRIEPLDAVDWLFYAAGAIGVLGAVDALLWRDAVDASEPSRARIRARRVVQGVRTVVMLGVGAGLVWLLTRPMLVYHWTERTGWFWIGGITLVMTLLWLATDALASRAPQRSLAVAIALVAGGSALVIMLSGSQKLGQIAGVLTAALLGVATVGLFFPPRAGIARGMVLVYVVLHTSLVVTASHHVYATLTTINGLLLLSAVPLAWAGQLAGRNRPRTEAIVGVAAALTPVAVAVILAGVDFARASRSSQELMFMSP